MAALVVGPFRSFSQFPLLFAFFVPFRNLGRPPGVYPYSDTEPDVYPYSEAEPGVYPYSDAEPGMTQKKLDMKKIIISAKTSIFEILFCNSETICILENDIENHYDIEFNHHLSKNINFSTL